MHDSRSTLDARASHLAADFFAPSSSEDVIERLRTGNEGASRAREQACDRGGSHHPLDELGQPSQMPIAVMIGCSDARVPPEKLFNVGYNDLFIIRSAGNVLGIEAVGSLLYAVHAFAPPNELAGRSLRLAVTVGHRGCGAVKATIEMFQKGIAPGTATGGPLDSILGRIAGPPLQVGVAAFDAVHGVCASYQRENLPALLDLVIYLNAAQVSREVRQWIEREVPSAASSVAVVYGVLDPLHHHLHARPPTPGTLEHGSFASPPRDDLEFRELARDLVDLIAPRT